MLNIHYHSECQFFAGCENMLANFFNSEKFHHAHRVTFSYVQSAQYEQGFRRRVNKDISIYPVKFPDISDGSKLPEYLPLPVRKISMAVFRMVLNTPLLVYEAVVLYRLFKEIKPDILHINNGGYPAAMSARSAAIAGKWAAIPKVLMVVNNMAVDYRQYSRWFDYPIDRVVVRSVDLFITGSLAASARLRKVLHLPASQVTAIHNGITLRSATSSVSATRKRLGLDDYNGVVFGVVALLIPRKGHQVLLDSILKLVTEKKFKGNEFKVLIEGDGPLRQELAEFVACNNISSWITFVGDEENVSDFMASLDVLILPSVQEEDFPNVILEAMALGKPVIASRLAGTPEQVLDGETGLLCEPRNVAQLADAIGLLMDRPDLRNLMAKTALNRFNTYFTSKVALDNYSVMYKKLIEKQQ